MLRILQDLISHSMLNIYIYKNMRMHILSGVRNIEGIYHAINAQIFFSDQVYHTNTLTLSCE